MLPDELIKKVRLIEITTRKMVDDVMSGSYRSSFKGQGVSVLRAPGVPAG